VQLNSWQKAGDPAPRAIESSSQVLALTPIEFHLKESKPHLQSCKADAGLAPSVAP